MYPILLEFGVITVFSLWFFVALGFIAGSLLLVRYAKRNRIRLNLISENSVALFAWTILISRATFVALHTDLYFYGFKLRNIFDIFAFWDKGFSFWGAVFAWILGILYLAKKRGESAQLLWDVTAPSLLAGMAIGNIGAFLDGVNYGTPTSLPWGIVFRSAHVKYISAIHPTQLYSALYCALLAGGLFLLVQWLRGRLPGVVAELGLFAFSIFKFLEELVRGDETVRIFSARLSQLLAAAGIVAGAYLLYQRYHNKNGGDPERLMRTTLRRFLNRFSRRTKSDPAKMAEGMNQIQNQTA